jgi:hypothetical protein
VGQNPGYLLLSGLVRLEDVGLEEMVLLEVLQVLMVVLVLQPVLA